MRCRGLLVLIAAAAALGDTAERGRIVEAVRAAVTAGKPDEALALLKDARASTQDDFLAAGLCLLARRPEDAAR